LTGLVARVYLKPFTAASVPRATNEGVGGGSGGSRLPRRERTAPLAGGAGPAGVLARPSGIIADFHEGLE
jgi:hypothetical protein